MESLADAPPSPPPPSRSIRLGKGGTLRQRWSTRQPTNPARLVVNATTLSNFSMDFMVLSISLAAVAAATSDFRCAVPMRRGGPQKRQRRATPCGVGRVALYGHPSHFLVSLFPFSSSSPPAPSYLRLRRGRTVHLTIHASEWFLHSPLPSALPPCCFSVYMTTTRQTKTVTSLPGRFKGKDYMAAQLDKKKILQFK